MRSSRNALARARALLDQLPPKQREGIDAALAELEAEITGAALSARREEFLAALKKGSWVYLPRYRQRCAVRKVDRARREVSVLLGKMNLAVPFDEVTWWDGA